MPVPAVGGRGGGGGGGGGGGAGGSLANTGDYLVTMTVGGQTYKQSFRVERVSGGSDVGGGFGTDDDQHDQSGRFTPKTPKSR
jgi:hypothetical protein